MPLDDHVPIGQSPSLGLSEETARREPGCILSRFLFLRLLGFAYLSAFASLWPQILGLIGSHGILPARNFLASMSSQPWPVSFLSVPTLFWLNSSDTALVLVCAAGTAVSLLLICGVLPIPSLAVLWALYLTLVDVGQDFLGFQWDELLLETGFLAIFFAPGAVLPRLSAEAPPSRAILWLLRVLLFRLMFMSGGVKLGSGDPTWRHFTALAYHFETQPLPTPLAWYAFHLPYLVLKISTFLTLVIEIGAPFLIFFGRRTRIGGFALLSGLQVLILLTGNYAFFNWLTIALCILLLDDDAIRSVIPSSFLRHASEPENRPAPGQYRRWIVWPAAVVLGSLAAIQFVTAIGGPGEEIVALEQPWHLVNGYGLFAVMTTTRPEIMVEGSNDGIRWKEYGFRFQPQNLSRISGWVAPYQPRLDWQMWFAALGGPDDSPWFSSFLTRLLQGSPEVLGLLQSNPFPDHAPRFIRAVLYEYRFTPTEIRNTTGAYWQRRRVGLFMPAVRLESGTEPASEPQT